MNNEDILSKIQSLPEDIKAEVSDFIEYLSARHEKKIRKQSRKAPVFGSCKDLFIIPDDFDETPEDFKEYM